MSPTEIWQPGSMKCLGHEILLFNLTIYTFSPDLDNLLLWSTKKLRISWGMSCLAVYSSVRALWMFYSLFQMVSFERRTRIWAGPLVKTLQYIVNFTLCKVCIGEILMWSHSFIVIHIQKKRAFHPLPSRGHMTQQQLQQVKLKKETLFH